MIIGVARGGHGRAFALPSANFALPSKPFFFLKLMYIREMYIEELTWTQQCQYGVGLAMKCDY